MQSVIKAARSTELVPVDIFSIKEYGIDRWRENFYWPVSDDEFVRLAQEIDGCLRNHITNGPEKIRKLFLIQAVLRTEYWHFIHTVLVEQRFKKVGLAPLLSDHTFWYEYAKTASPVNRHKIDSKSSFRQLSVPLIRSVAHNLSFAKLRNFRAGSLLVYGGLDALMKEYIARTPRIFKFMLASHVTGQSEIGDLIAHKEASALITDELSAIACKHGIALSSAQQEYLFSVTTRSLGKADEALSHATLQAKSLPPQILVSGLGSTYIRALCVAARKRGIRITCFSHGGNIGLYDTPFLAFSEFALCDEFITYTSKSAELFKKIMAMHPQLSRQHVEVTDCDSAQYRKAYERKGRSHSPTSIKRVMLIGYPHNQWRKPQSAGGFSLFHLDMELRLCELLKDNGYDVIYKTHPDRLLEAEGIFDEVAEVRAGLFEECMDEADAYIFGSIRTTAFPLSLCTSKPVIGLVSNENPYKPFNAPMEMLKKRCALIETNFDERNRFSYDEEKILDRLRAPNGPCDSEFIETYMFTKK